MDKKTKEALRRYKKNKAREASSSDSSSSSDSDTGTSSSYSSSDSDECKSNAFRRHRKKKTPRSDEDHRSKREKREHCQKKLEAKRDHLKRKLKEAKLKKRAAAAAAVLSGHSHRSSLSPSTQAKLKKLAERKHLREVSKEVREREKHRSVRGDHEREHHHSRSPSKIAKLRLHQDVLKQQQQQQTKSPQHMHQLMSREKIIIQARTHDDRRDRDRERAEREAARDKERAEALARCQERQRERERIAREKMRRDEDEQKKYGDTSGQSTSGDRMLLSNDREMLYASGSNRGYNSRERSLEALERARYSTKRELDMYERDRNYLDVERHGIHERSADGIRHDRECLSSRRRETSPLSDRYTPRSRDLREAYPEEDRDRNYGRSFQSNETASSTHLSRDRGNWLDSREIREPDVASDGRDYRDRDLDLMYSGENERLIRERKAANPIRGNEQWKNNWNSSRESNEWAERAPIISSGTSAPPPAIRKNDYNDGFKRTSGEMVGATAAVPPSATREPMRAANEADWDVDNHKKAALRAGENSAPMKKSGDAWWDTRRDFEKTPVPNTNTSVIMGTESCEPPHGNPFWQNDWHSGIMPTEIDSNQLGAPNMMHRVRNYRERPGPMSGYRAQHPPPLMNVSVQPPQPRMYHGVSPRLPNKRNMTYTNPNLIKKQQQNAIAAMKAASQASAVVAVAAAKAAAQSAANSTTNPGILGQVVRQQQQQQQQLQYIENKPEAGEIIENTINVTGMKKITNNNNKNNSMEQQTKPLIELDKVSGELSEISDSDDDILNTIEKKPKLDSDLLSLNTPQPVKDAPNEIAKITQIKDESITTSTAIATATTVINNNEIRVVVDEEDMLDFEEISDGELEEDARHKNIGDALGVDWASLISENKEHAIENNMTNFNTDANETAKKRWQSHRILINLGISCAMAGEEFAKQLLKESQKKSNEQTDDIDSKKNIKIKKEKKDEEDTETTNESSDSPKVDKEVNSVDALQPYAFAQVNHRRRLNARKQMFANICGPFSRALSARKDLLIRRQLCDLPVDDDEFSNRPIPIMNAKIKNLALNAFRCALHVK